MPRYDCIFDSVFTVEHYDRLRFIAPRVLRACAELIVREATVVGEAHERTILDAGCGTGRFLRPVAEVAEQTGMRLRLIGLDLSARMLQEMVRRFNGWASSAHVTVVPLVADLQERLPLHPSSVHLVFTVATFHILQRWREAAMNLVEVLSPHGRFIVIQENNQFMHQTEGFSRDCDFPYLDDRLSQFMHYYHLLRARHGHPYEPSEVRYSDMRPLLRFLESLGLQRKETTIDSRLLKWQKPHTYGDILDCFRNRGMTTWGSDLPEEVRSSIARALDAWVAEQGIDPHEEFFLPAELVPHVFVKRGGER